MAIARLNRQAKRPYGLCAKTTAVTILGLCFIFVWSFFSSSSSTSVTARRESFDDIAEPISGNLRVSNFGTQITHENEKNKKKSGSDLEKDDKRVNGSVSVSKSINEHKSEKKNTRVVANKKKLPEKKPKKGNDNKPVESEGEEDSEKEKEEEGLVVDGKEETLDGEGEEAEGENVLAEAVDQEESEEKKLESDGGESNRGKKRKKIKGPVFDPKMKYNWKLCSTKSKHNYIPCIDYDTSSLRPQSYRHTERSCPKTPVMCLVPLPHDGYEIPIRWPESKLKILYKNVAHPKLAAFVKKHSWIMESGEYLTFPQNQSEFKGGVLHYLESIEETVPDIEWGKNIRVVLDIGCTDSSFGASLLDKEVLTVSLGLKDDLVDLAQVALERGFPTIVSPFGGRRLPFPSGVFDAIHCGECSIKWHSNGGKHLLEMNRILRPGGYFILSTKHDNIEDEEAMTTLTAAICWNILAHRTDDVSEVGVKIYQKPESNDIYGLRRRKNPPLCKENENPDAAWYVPMKTCLHPIPSAIEQHGTEWPEEWPKRLDTVPDWLDDKDKLVADSMHWSSIIEKSYLTGLGIDWANVRNVMDMKAIYGGFAAALAKQNVWVMNVVPVHKDQNRTSLRRHSLSLSLSLSLPEKMRSTEETTREKKTSPGELSEKSRESVGKLLTRPNKHRSRGTKNNDNNMQQYDLSSEVGNGSKVNGIQDVDLRVKSVTLEAGSCSTDAARDTLREEKVDGGTLQDPLSDSKEEMNDSDWEDGSIPNSDFTGNQEVTIEFDETPDSVKRKPVRRATAEDKELAEIVHKVHLLCLLGRGRLIDRACDDPLTQAALLSLLPRHLLNISQITKLTAKNLHPLIHWFQDNFHVRSSTDEKRLIHSTLAFALETREGTSEEIAALSVALFRALGLTTRFVSILDVASLKPDGDKSDYFSQDAGGSIFCTSTPMVAKKNETSSSPSKSFSPNEKDSACETSHRSSCKRSNAESKDSASANESSNKQPCPLVFELKHDSSGACHTQISQGPKRKGDIEFSLQMEMAISATAAGIANIADGKMGSSMGNPNSNLPNFISPFKRMKKVVSEGSSSSHGISTAIGSRRVGSPLYWAEVYCSGENLTGKWVHVDAVNAIIDEEEKVEALAAACKRSLRYVVAFAGNGAKDVTRRYCMKWYKIASKRVNSFWWDSVLAPLKEIESRATNGMFHLENDNIDGSFKHDNPKNIAENLKAENFPNNATLLGSSGLEVSKVCGVKTDMGSSLTASRSSLEDMELETRALTEPLPTNQQAYRTHQLYAIEKWLTKYQILHPRGPILGFCAGHAVYPRTCVQTLKTKERWLRDGLQVKASELPVKELKRSGKLQKLKSFEDDESVGDNSEGTLKLYGKWQLEPLQLPHAVNGIVPKNERGQVDVWSEKCLPPGTVHLRLPRVFSVAKRLEIDYAPAMVGFEYKNGQSYPVFEGIVVCAEFKDVILEAYREEQERREAEEKKRNEMQAISRWYQLLSSIVTQQRLKNRYGKGVLSHSSSDEPTVDNNLSLQVSGSQDDKQSLEFQKGNKHQNKPNPPARSPSAELEEDHKHLFLTEDQSFDDESLILTKRCHCGFSVQVEEL